MRKLSHVKLTADTADRGKCSVEMMDAKRDCKSRSTVADAIAMSYRGVFRAVARNHQLISYSQVHKHLT